jgi:shikimate dehydrogenase
MELKMMVTVVARNPSKAEGLSGRYADAIEIIPDDSPSLAHCVLASDLLVNTTPLGMNHLSDCSPLPDGLVPEPRTVVFDLVYGRTTPLLALSRAVGCTTLDGLEMLLYQGAASFQLWTGVEPSINVMREACLKALGEVTAC